MKEKYGFLSCVLAVVGTFLFYLSSKGSNGIINLYFFTGLFSWITSFVLGIKGVKAKESGALKYIGMGSISLIVIGFGLLIVIYGIIGFGA